MCVKQEVFQREIRIIEKIASTTKHFIKYQEDFKQGLSRETYHVS